MHHRLSRARSLEVRLAGVSLARLAGVSLARCSLWVLLVVGGCGAEEPAGAPAAVGEGEAEAASRCTDEQRAYPVSWETTVRPFLLSYCDSCHAEDSPQRFGAPAAVTFDTRSQGETWAERIRVRTVVDEDMPVGGGVFPNDLMLLSVWLDCGDTFPAEAP